MARLMVLPYFWNIASECLTDAIINAKKYQVRASGKHMLHIASCNRSHARMDSGPSYA